MTANFKALCRIFTMIVKVDMKSGECIIIKNGETHGIDVSGVTNFGQLIEVLTGRLSSQADADRLSAFTNLSTLMERVGSKSHVLEDFKFADCGWCRVSLVPDQDDTTGIVDHCLLTFFDIDEVKQEEMRKQKEMERNNLVLKEALAVANHASQAKTTFLNSMSHDIRTPMNAIIGFTSLAAAHIDNRDAVADYLKKITVSSNHLLSLINDVLDMSRIESGRTKLEEKEVSLPQVLHDLRSIVQSNIQAKQLDFFVDIQDVIHENVMVDKLRLNQVLLNILGNAIKFTPSGGTISLRVIETPCPRQGLCRI